MMLQNLVKVGHLPIAVWCNNYDSSLQSSMLSQGHQKHNLFTLRTKLLHTAAAGRLCFMIKIHKRCPFKKRYIW